MKKSEELKNNIKKDLEALNNKDYIWYTVQVYNGSELAVKKQMLELDNIYSDELKYILCPYEEVISISTVKKQKNILKKALFPSYLFIALKNPLKTELKLVFRQIPKYSQVLDAILTPVDIKKIHDNIEKVFKSDFIRYKKDFQKGDNVIMLSGPFENFKGTITRIDHDNNIAYLNVNIFGRDTPVDIPMDQIKSEE